MAKIEEVMTHTNSDASTMFGNRVANVPLRLSKKNHIWVYIYDE